MQVVGYGHPDVASTYYHIAIVYTQQGQYEKALEYCQQSLDMKIRSVGLDHPDVSRTNLHIASMSSVQDGANSSETKFPAYWKILT